MDECIHHWIIDPVDGPTSTGTCKKCGATRQHENYYKAPPGVPMQTKEEQEYNRLRAYGNIPFGQRGLLRV